MVGICPEKLFEERSRVVRNPKTFVRLVGRVPDKRLLERSKPVIEVQFSSAKGNSPFSPMSDRWIFKTLFSPGCQHSMPVNLHMNPSVLLLKTHVDKTFSGSSTESLKALRQLISLWTALLKVIYVSIKRQVVIIGMLLILILVET